MCTAMPVCLSTPVYSYLLFSAVVLGGDDEVSFETAATTRVECILRPSKQKWRDPFIS